MNMGKGLIILLVFFTMPAVTQERGPQRREERPSFDEQLLRVVRQVDESPQSIRGALVQVLGRAEITGGVALSSCDSPETLVTLHGGESVRTGLIQIMAARSGLSLGDSGMGVVNVLDTGRITNILETPIRSLRVTDIKTTTLAIQQIFETPEVRLRMRELKLHDPPFSRIEAGAQKLDPLPRTPLPLQLEQTTVRRALNAMAVGLGRGLWLYQEGGCSGDRWFEAIFVVQ